MSKHIDLLKVTSGTRVNDRFLLKNQNLRDIVGRTPLDFTFKNFKEDLEDLKWNITKNNVSLTQQSFLYVVTETVYKYPSTCITEKTIKPIVCKRPFVIVGPVGSLENLKKLGFQTFNNYWNESYDLIEDDSERILAVVDIIEWVCSKSVVDLQNLCSNMQDVLNYNFNFFVNEFKKQQFEKLEHACIENLKPRYD